MNLLRNEKGMALVTSLLLTLISLTIVLSLLYLITQGIKTSAAQKRYSTSLAAAHGGLEIFSKEIIPRILKGDTTTVMMQDFNSIYLNIPASACLNDKLTKETGSWANCTASAISTDAKASYDVSFKLRGLPLQPSITVYSKITGTTPGNTDPSGIDYLDSAASVAGTASGVNPKHMPAMYRIEVQGERETNATEKAKLSVLYAY